LGARVTSRRASFARDSRARAATPRRVAAMASANDGAASDATSTLVVACTTASLYAFGDWFLKHILCAETRDLISARVSATFSATFAVTSSMLFLIGYEIANAVNARTLRWCWAGALGSGTAALLGVAPWELFALGFEALGGKGGGRDGAGGAGRGRRRRAYAWATAATGGFAYAFLGLARRGASGEDDGSVMVRVVSRTAVLGICLLGVLSGFGMVHFPYTTVRIFHRAIPDAEVSGLERRLVQSVETIVERKKRIEILKYEIAREARMERDRNSKNGGGGSLFNRLAGGFRLPGLGEARGEQILAISAEIEALEMVNNTLFFDLHDVNLQRQRAKMSKTPYGRFLELCGVGMAVVCGYRLVAGFKRLIFKQTPTSDPISFALHIFLANKAIHIDPATLAQYLSLLLIAFLVINSMQNFITQLVKLFFAYGGGVTTDALVLFTTEMVGLYFLSSVLLVREQLPERYRHVVTEALGADLEFRFYAKFYELIFMASAALTAIALYAKHVTATVTADVSKPVRRA
jgi:hypothetical protein